MLDIFNDNPYIAPSIAGFRRFLMKCEPRAAFAHVIFACGTVVRVDIADQITAPVELSESQKPYYNWSVMRSEEVLDVSHRSSIVNAYKALFAPPKLGTATVNTIICDMNDAGMPTWVTHVVDNPYPGASMIVTPGTDHEEAAEYALHAYRVDFECPCVYAVLIPLFDPETNYVDGYRIVWFGTEPGTLHMPKTLE